MDPDMGQTTTILPAGRPFRPASISAPLQRGRPETVPGHRVVILGAGRNPNGRLPTALRAIGRNRRVLDWLKAAFDVLGNPKIHLVTGFRSETFGPEAGDIGLIFNPDWATTGPAGSLALAPLTSGRATYISYADVVFRPGLVREMENVEADIVLAADSHWQQRYDARSRVDLEGAEKIAAPSGIIEAIGKRIPLDRATAEFAGLARLSARAADRLAEAVTCKELNPAAGLPDVIEFLLTRDLSAETIEVHGGWAELNAPQDLARFVLGTKAESLERLRPLVRLGRINPQVSFTRQQWHDKPADVLERIARAFAGQQVIVRSSALSEDTWHHSSAGAYTSILDVPADQSARLAEAIDEVIGSYGPGSPDDQALVQQMLTGVALSGVAMTRTPTLGAAYYVINYDDTTARTNSVTAGDGAAVRTLILHRQATDSERVPRNLQPVLEAICEIEHLVRHDSLDIEFAVTADGTVHILQVRPIAVTHGDAPVDDQRLADGLRDAVRFFAQLNKPDKPFLLGRRTQLSVMTDWNPAEIIGTKPSRLAFSLYRQLITDETWARQRAEYGYRDVRPCNLLVDVLGHPYIDVRATFNSFVPAELPDNLAGPLIDTYLDRLAAHPELHDKVEFDVLHTCLTFDFDDRMAELRKAGFTAEQIDQLREALRSITARGIARCSEDLARLDEGQRRFERIQAADLPPLERVYLLLEDVRLHGVNDFAHLARAGFVAVSLLRSLIDIGLISQGQADAFLASLGTVSSRIQDDAARVADGELAWNVFVERYGHLRPGTYDITSPTYASAAEEYLRPMVASARERAPKPLESRLGDDATRQNLGRLLDETGLGVDVEGFERFLRQAIEGREFGKFVFTRHLSAALETLAQWGSALGLRREELAQIRIQDLLALRAARADGLRETLRTLADAGREEAGVTQAACLPGQVVGPEDLLCFEQLKTMPNFITRRQVRGPVLCLSARTRPNVDLTGKIVVTPNADPGFDWIFSRPIAGLLTLYGGSNSHMAIRAAEFELPAATGIGERLYQKVSAAEIIELDCQSQQIRIVR